MRMDDPCGACDPRDFADAYDAALKSLRAIFQITGRSPDAELLSSISVIVTLLENGGGGWLERLIAAHHSVSMRMAARLSMQEMDGYAITEAERARHVLAWIARPESYQ